MKTAVCVLLACVPTLVLAQPAAKKPLFSGQPGKVTIAPGKPVAPVPSLNEVTPEEKDVIDNFPHEYEKAYRKILLTFYRNRTFPVSNGYVDIRGICLVSRADLLRQLAEKSLKEALEIGPPVPLEFANPIGIGFCARTAPKGENVFVRGAVDNACFVCTGARMVDGERIYIIDAIPLEDVTWLYRGAK